MIVKELHDIDVVLRCAFLWFLLHLRHIALTFSQNSCFDFV